MKILKPGLHTTVQDLGRFGYQAYGIPSSGVMDARSAARANQVVNNTLEAAVLEMTWSGPTLLFTTPTRIGLSGADMFPTLQNKPVAMNTAIPVHPGDTLSFGQCRVGYRGYLAVAGGIHSPKVLGSRSMYIGITPTAKLSTHDTFMVDEVRTPVPLNASLSTDESFFSNNTLEVFPGPEYDLLTAAQQQHLFSTPFVVSSASNRMAYLFTTQLDNALRPIISSLVLPGTIQLTPSGQVIALMRDCQTTGGYPRILQLQRESIDILAQKTAHRSVYFKLITT